MLEFLLVSLAGAAVLALAAWMCLDGIRWLARIIKTICRIVVFACIGIGIGVATIRPVYYEQVARFVVHRYLFPLARSCDLLFAGLAVNSPPISWTPPPPTASIMYGLFALCLLCVTLGVLLKKRATRHDSGGRLGQPRDTTTAQSDPVLSASLTTLFTSLQGLLRTPATPKLPTQEFQQQVIQKLDNLTLLMRHVLQGLGCDPLDNVLSVTSCVTPVMGIQSTIPSGGPQAPTVPKYSLGLEVAERSQPRTTTPMTDELHGRLGGVSQEEALRILQNEAKLRKDEARRPKYLTEEEKLLSADELYLHLKQQNLLAREADFLDQLPILPPDARTWSVTDIKRWFRDQRHEQWAVRKLHEGKTLFICPQCNRARDAEAHRCVSLWSRTAVNRSGVPTYQRTVLTPSTTGSFRVATTTTPDHQRVVQLQEQLTDARKNVTEANERLARAYATAQAEYTTSEPDQWMTDDKTFPYSTDNQFTPGSTSLPPQGTDAVSPPASTEHTAALSARPTGRLTPGNPSIPPFRRAGSQQPNT